MKINEERLWQNLHILGKIGANEEGAVTRLSYTKEDMQAKNWIFNKMKKAGLNTYEDNVGNVIGIYNPQKSKEAPVICGSHYDSVIEGGIFDGCLGVLGALEVAETFRENCVELKRPLYIIAYKDEEGNRFNRGMIGSKTIAGKACDDDFQVKDRQSISLYKAMKEWGYQPINYKQSQISPIYACIELHIEQGKVLENNDSSVGIVEGIPYIRCYEITISGESGHAGAIPMLDRRDPVVAMAKWIESITKIVAQFDNTVATIGDIQTFPGSSNVICDNVKFTLDIRSLFNKNIDLCLKQIQLLEKKLYIKGISVHYKLKQNIEGIQCDEKIKNQLEDIMCNNQINHIYLMSGAGHDIQSFKGVCPVGMIFVRSIGGYSHRKEEYSTKDDCANGANVLLNILYQLCNENSELLK